MRTKERMKPGIKPNMIRGVLRRTKEKNETGGKQPDGDAYPFLRPAMVAVVTMMSHRPAVAVVAPRGVSLVLRDIRSLFQTETPTRLLGWFRLR